MLTISGYTLAEGQQEEMNISQTSGSSILVANQRCCKSVFP